MSMPTKLSPLFATTGQAGSSVEAGAWRTVGTFGTLEDERAAFQEHAVLADISPMTRIQLEGESVAEMLKHVAGIGDVGIGKGVSAERCEVFRCRQDLWLLIAYPEEGDNLLAELASATATAPSLTTLTDFSDAKSQLWLAGPAAPQVLSRVCGLNFHENAFPGLSCAASSVAKTTQLIIRHEAQISDGTSRPSYSLIGDRSFAVYMWETLLEAGKDLDLVPAGWTLFRTVFEPT